MTPEQLREEARIAKRLGHIGWGDTFLAHAAVLEEIELLKEGEALMRRNAWTWKERAENAERRAERLKFHAEAMAGDLDDWVCHGRYNDCSTAESRAILDAYRAEFKE